MQASIEQVWAWLQEVPDPEIPAISVVELGIVRDVEWSGADDSATLHVTITPTYSGCPATQYIGDDIRTTLANYGVSNLKLASRIAPPWTTDWISDAGKQKLKDFGIAPPLTDDTNDRLGTRRVVACPQCDSINTTRVSEFGSTPCKAHYQCRDCLEPFDYFKCI
ncbi:MAG: ring-1,2-phenylacetyl-CoA epoxidase subunit PaaD [Parasphingorhabdus sp.]|jgi:ring-1,2-phenylacetyl-CoA epoxidase subunit PaaD